MPLPTPSSRRSRRRRYGPTHVEGYQRAEWILLDYFDFIVHVFSPRPASSTASSGCGANAADRGCRRRAHRAPESATADSRRTLAAARGRTRDRAASATAHRRRSGRTPCAACASCGRVLDRPLDGAVCEQCWVSLSCRPGALRSPSHHRPGTGDRPLRRHAPRDDARAEVRWPPLGCATTVATMAARGASVLTGADSVVPVPLHRRRERERGFNQADDLARGLGLPVWPRIAAAARHAPQVELPADERHHNVRDAFVASPSSSRPWRRTTRPSAGDGHCPGRRCGDDRRDAGRLRAGR